jgi:hypothetical protein
MLSLFLELYLSSYGAVQFCDINWYCIMGSVFKTLTVADFSADKLNMNIQSQIGRAAKSGREFLFLLVGAM